MSVFFITNYSQYTSYGEFELKQITAASICQILAKEILTKPHILHIKGTSRSIMGRKKYKLDGPMQPDSVKSLNEEVLSQHCLTKNVSQTGYAESKK